MSEVITSAEGAIQWSWGGEGSVCVHRCKEGWLHWLGTLCELLHLHVYSHTLDV